MKKQLFILSVLCLGVVACERDHRSTTTKETRTEHRNGAPEQRTTETRTDTTNR